jgi:putative hydrolase of the HAD superfamily
VPRSCVFALEQRFDDIQIEGEHGFGKPEERAYNHAMEVLGVGPDETWMVGDNLEWEIVAPQRLGIYAIWHDGLQGRATPQFPDPARPDHPPPVGIAAVAEPLGVPAGRWHWFGL